MRTANPALNDKIFQDVARVSSGEVMTLDGTVNKCMISIALTIATGYWSYCNPTFAAGLHWPLAIGTLIIALIVIFKQTTAPYLTPVYAIAEGLLLGSISLFFDTLYPGIAFNAASLTFATLVALLVTYKSGWIAVTENFKLGVIAATGGIFIVYLFSMILSFFGIPMSFLHDSSPLSIAISCGVVVVAALNLVLDFDFIENATASKSAPKYMEWYAAFGLLVTLVWLYVEILRLLAKLQSRD